MVIFHDFPWLYWLSFSMNSAGKPRQPRHRLDLPGPAFIVRGLRLSHLVGKKAEENYWRKTRDGENLGFLDDLYEKLDFHLPKSPKIYQNMGILLLI
jgi:hypothetical protein